MHCTFNFQPHHVALFIKYVTSWNPFNIHFYRVQGFPSTITMVTMTCGHHAGHGQAFQMRSRWSMPSEEHTCAELVLGKSAHCDLGRTPAAFRASIAAPWESKNAWYASPDTSKMAVQVPPCGRQRLSVSSVRLDARFSAHCTLQDMQTTEPRTGGQQQYCAGITFLSEGFRVPTDLLQDLATVLPGTDGRRHSAEDSIAQRPVHERACV